MSSKDILIILSILFFGCLNSSSQDIGYSIEGIAWIDRDEDGNRSINDTILPTVKVDLFNELGSMIQFATTDSEGRYLFSNLSEGSYYIKFERKQGLKLALMDAGDDETDSDISSSGISALFLLDANTPLVKLDAGFRSSIQIQTKAFINVCEDELVLIDPNIIGFSGDLSFMWSHDQSTGSSTSFVAESNLLLELSVMDDWNLPVIKKIYIRLNKGVSVKDCEDVDVFDFTEVPIDILVSEANPGPISVTDEHEDFIGGGRRVSIELLEGENISSINSSNAGVFINNCSGCRTSTTLSYYSPTNEPIDISEYDYFELTEMSIDQGNVEVTILIESNAATSSLSRTLESEGPSSNILPVFFFEDFDNYDQMDYANISSISLNFTSINESIDVLMSSILSCKDKSCQTSLIQTQDICFSDSVTLAPESTCQGGLIYFWDDLGFGKDKVVSPLDTNTYNLTIYDQNGCQEMHSTTVNVSQPPTIELVSPTIVCAGETITLNAQISSGHGPYKYQWNDSVLDTPDIEVLMSMDTTIKLTVTDVYGCISETETVIVVNPTPSVSLSVVNTSCTVSTGSITAQVNGGLAPYKMVWSNGIEDQVSITDLDFGLYTLTVTDELGCSTVASALVNYLPCAEIGDFVWHDVNYNGIQDSLDQPLEHSIVILRDELDEEIRRDTTNENGRYLFDELDGGEYYVEFVPPTDFYLTIPLASLDENLDSNVDTLNYKTDKIILLDFEKNHSIDAGWYKKVCIGDQVWSDINLNHYFDSLDVGIDSVLVKLLDCNQNLLDSSYTDTLGNYAFCDLNPGDYTLQFCDFDGFVPVDQNVGDESIDSDLDPENSLIGCKSLLSGDTLNDCDAGFYNISSLGNYVWHDSNANGIQEQLELPLEGVALNLFKCDGQFVSSTITDSMGYYLFDSLPAGDYFLEVTPLQNSFLTSENIGLDSLIDSDFLIAENRTSCIYLPPGVHRKDIDAGLYYKASLGDFVWIDHDLNGLQDLEEVAVENLKIFLYSCDNDLVDSTYSDETGYYIFEELIPRMYKISIELKENHAVTILNNSDLVLNNDINALSLESKCVTLASTQDYRDLDIGLYNLGKIGNLVWYDENGNGLQENFEMGVPDVTVTLLDCNDHIVSTVLSGSQGEYCFNDIPYGDYSVHFDIPEPYFIVNPNEGSDDSVDSNPDPSTGTIECISITTPLDSTLDAGITTCSTIGGTAWFDVYNLNSIKDPFENGVNGIKVKAYKNINGNWNLVNTSYTGLKPGHYSEDGYWEMCISPGDYYFEFSNISVVEAVEPNQGNDDTLDSDVVHEFGVNTTDVITVYPGIDNLSIGIGYRWKNNLKKMPQYQSNKVSSVFFDETESTFSIQYKPETRNDDQPTKTQGVKRKNLTKTKIFPNPTQGLIKVHVSGANTEQIEFVIYENTGRIIKTPQVQKINNTWSIDASGVISGMHHILIIKEDKIEWAPFIKI